MQSYVRIADLEAALAARDTHKKLLDRFHPLLYFVEMAKGDALGEFEQIVMLAILRLREEAYGMTVRREIEARTGRESAIGAVYATLDRLETKGLVRSRETEASAERGGRPRRIYELTAAGSKSLERTQRALASMMEGLKFRPLWIK